MKLYKKVVPYILTGATMLMMGCESQVVYHSDVVVAKKNGNLYLDSNGDGAADRAIRFNPADSVSDVFYNYAMVGDTVGYNTAVTMDWDYHRVLGQGHIELSHINGYKRRDLEKIKLVNKLRSEIGQKKTRTL